MNRVFLYVEENEGGMHTFEVRTKSDLENLYGWMSTSCEDDDKYLLEFFETAKVGDYTTHRLGLMVRVRA